MIDQPTALHVEHRSPPGILAVRGERAASPAGIIAVGFILAVFGVYIATSIHSQNVALADAKAQLDQANSRAEKAQASLAAATSQATTLQVQLTGNQDVRSSLQSKLDQARAQISDMQAEMTKDLVHQSDLQSQLEQAKAQLARASKESAEIQSQLDQARSQASDSRAQLARAQVDLTRAHPLIVEARHLPLTTAFEKSFWDQGFMLHITNPGSTPLTVRVTFSGADKARSEKGVIDGGATLNVGNLPAGENVVIASDGFDPLNLTAR
jgi:hypothetical protein